MGFWWSLAASIVITTQQDSFILGLGEYFWRRVRSRLPFTTILWVSPFGTKREAANSAKASAFAFVARWI